MKKTFSLLAMLWMLMSQSFAADGIKTIIKGNVNKKDVKVINLFKREMMRRPAASSAVKTNGQFQLALNLTTAGFYLVSDSLGLINGFEMYLNPGDQLTVKIENDEFIMSGKGSGINQLLYENHKKYPYNEADPTSFSQTYINRIKAINSSANGEVIRKRTLLLGNEQGEYLSKTYRPLIESRGYPTGKGMIEVNFTDLNISLVPEIVIYPNWSQLITELMFAKMNAGQLKVNSIQTWVADFGHAIENQRLKEDYVVAMLESAVSYSDFTSINEVIKAALPLIKDPQKRARANALKSKVSQRIGFYKNAMPGTNLSSYTFNDINGKQVSISDFKGKFIYIDIWTTGCMPCMAEAPYLKKIEHEMEGKDIVFLSISCDSGPEVWKKTIERYQLTGGQQLLMSSGYNDPFFERVGKSGVPRFLILDKEGKMFDYNSSKRPSNPLLKIYLTELTNKSL
jgi:thiol-disulfide isomerase/thioredoxin